MQITEKELRKKSSISKTQLNYWIRCGAIIPKKNAIGSGQKREYTMHNLVEAIICSGLGSFGVRPSVMKLICDKLRESDDKKTNIVIHDELNGFVKIEVDVRRIISKVMAR